MSDDTKRLILARRARFVAAALAGLATDACGKTTATPEVPAEIDASTPMVCLTFTAPPPEPPAPDAAAPAPCLSAAPPLPASPPHPCLKPPSPPKCDPPFTIDKDGKKHFKPECL